MTSTSEIQHSNTTDDQYLQLLNLLLESGEKQEDRTGVGTYSIFGHQMRFDLSAGFPLLTTKKLHTKSIFLELLWFLRGETNNNWLKERGVSIWDEWADKDGNLGPVYGKQWRAWEGDPILNGSSYAGRVQIDQIAELIKLIKQSPTSRRQIVTAWNPADISKVALAWCHCFFQTRVSNGKLSLQMYQRSADTFLGLPFNIASYALLTHILADQCGLEAGELIWTGGDVHLYTNHVEQATEQLTRTAYPLPTLKIKRVPASFEDYDIDDFVIENYTAHPSIKAAVAV